MHACVHACMCKHACVCMCKEMGLRCKKKITVTELGWGWATQYSIPTSLCPAAMEQQSTQHWKRKIHYFYSYCEQQTLTINKQQQQQTTTTKNNLTVVPCWPNNNKQTTINNNKQTTTTTKNNLTVVPCWPLLPQRHRPAQLHKGSQQCCATHTETPETARKTNRWWPAFPSRLPHYSFFRRETDIVYYRKSAALVLTLSQEASKQLALSVVTGVNST